MLSYKAKSNRLPRPRQRSANPAPRRAELGSSAAGGGAVGAARHSGSPLPLRRSAPRPFCRSKRERFPFEAARREDGRRLGACLAGAAEGTSHRRAEGTRRCGRLGGSATAPQVRCDGNGGFFLPAFRRRLFVEPPRDAPFLRADRSPRRNAAGRGRSFAFRPRGWALGGEKGTGRVPPGRRCYPSPGPTRLFPPPATPGGAAALPAPKPGPSGVQAELFPTPSGGAPAASSGGWGGTCARNLPRKGGSSTSRYLTPGRGHRGEPAVPGAAAGKQTEVPTALTRRRISYSQTLH